jgi:hypothetical protein
MSPLARLLVNRTLWPIFADLVISNQAGDFDFASLRGAKWVPRRRAAFEPTPLYKSAAFGIGLINLAIYVVLHARYVAVCPQEIGMPGVTAIEFAFVRIIAVEAEIGVANNSARCIFALHSKTEPGRWHFPRRTLSNHHDVARSSQHFFDSMRTILDEYAAPTGAGHIIWIRGAKHADVIGPWQRYEYFGRFLSVRAVIADFGEHWKHRITQIGWAQE